MGEVLCNGFNLAVIYILVTERDKTRICIVSIKGKTIGFIHINWVYFVSIMSFCLRRYSVLYELNTLDACWIAVDVWSNSSRCGQELVYLSRTWCLYTWSCLDILITMQFSISCSTLICSPTIIFTLSWEKQLVKPMAPRSISYHISFQSTFICIFTFPIYIIKIQKLFILSYYLYQISLFTSGREGIDNPFIALVASSCLFV